MEAWRSGISTSRGPDLQRKSLIPGGLLMEAASPPPIRYPHSTPMSVRRDWLLQRHVIRHYLVNLFMSISSNALIFVNVGA
jgi:hypothetical protein